MALTQQPFVPESSEELAGDLAPFSSALGSPEALASLAALADLVQTPRPESLPAVRAFLDRYRERLLAQVELPAVREAHRFAAESDVAGLLALDRSLRGQFGPAGSAFAAASRHVGRTQLRRLRPLRDRTLQRYLRAVEADEASGWHVVVFGILLATFSLPLRQGLAHYAEKTQHSLLDSATSGLRISATDHAQLRSDCDVAIRGTLQQALPAFTPRTV